MDKIVSAKRKTELTLGFLYLLFTASSVTGFYLIQSVTDHPSFLINVYPQKSKLALGVIFQLVNDAVVIAIGIIMFGLFKKISKNIAAGILVTRVYEATVLVIGKMSLFLLMTISKEYINTGSTTGSPLAILGTLAIKWNAWAFEFAMLGLGIGGWLLCWLLFKQRLIPRLISVMGMIGYVLLFIRSILNILGYSQGFELFVPVALFEFIFPVWLIVKGFNQSHIMYRQKEV